MRTSLPIWMYTAVASTMLIGLVLPVQQLVATPGDAAVTTAAPSGGAPPGPPPAIAFDTVTPIVMDRRDAGGRPYATVILKNDGPKPQTAGLSVVLFDRSDTELGGVADPLQKEIPPGRPYLVSLTLRQNGNDTATPVDRWWREKLPVRGYVVLTTAGLSAAPITRELRIAPAQPSPEADRVVALSLLAAVLAVVAGLWWAGGHLLGRMGSPSWSDSWGSNATLGASLLTVFVGLVVFPEQTRFLPKTTYSVLSAVFPAIVGLSPVIFGLVRTPAPPAGSSVEYQGYVWAFCLAAVFTLWGATGQLATLVYAILELRATPAFPPGLSRIMLVIASGLLVSVLVYGVVSVRQIIDAVNAPAPEPDPQPTGHTTIVKPADTAPPRPVLNWPLL